MVSVAVGAPAPALAAATPRFSWWRYLERARTHEVLAEWRESEGMLVLRETSPGAPDARVSETLPAGAMWEARVAVWQLECRLATMGAYWQQRSHDSNWRRLGTPPGAPSPDLRRNAVIDAPHAPLVHHYHDERGGGDRLVAALKSAKAQRYVVLRAQLDVPSLNIGRIDVLHAELPDVLTKSTVLREQLHLMQTGMGKLVTRDDYVRSFGTGGDHRAAQLVHEVVSRVRQGQLERPAYRPEDSDAYAEFLVTINDPRLRALHARYLAPGEEDSLLSQGPIGIRKWIAAKRATSEHNAQHLLTILEASLLARERLKSGKLVRSDPEIRSLTRLAYYL